MRNNFFKINKCKALYKEKDPICYYNCYYLSCGETCGGVEGSDTNEGSALRPWTSG